MPPGFFVIDPEGEAVGEEPRSGWRFVFLMGPLQALGLLRVSRGGFYFVFSKLLLVGGPVVPCYLFCVWGALFAIKPVEHPHCTVVTGLPNCFQNCQPLTTQLYL